MKEGITITLDSMHGRLLKSRELALENASVGESGDEILLRDIRARFGDSRMARSDDLITVDQAARLDFKTERLRNGLFRVGSPFTLDTHYISFLEEGVVTEEEAQRLFFIEDEETAVRAELDHPEIGAGEKFGMMIDGERKIYLGFDFESGFWINVDFGDQEESSLYAEYHNYDNLKNMTVEEYFIFSHFMGIGQQMIDEKS